MTTQATPQSARAAVLNLPNQLTILRLVLAFILVALIGLEFYAAALAVFLVAASTDWLDGYLARKYHLVTVLGRILDPFVDKIIVCGAFICLVEKPGSQVPGWMAVVIVGRELFVTALRSFLEQQGADFSANFAGKLKMIVQCIAVTLSLLLLTGWPPGVHLADWVQGAMWATLTITVYSGAGYAVRAIRLLRN